MSLLARYQRLQSAARFDESRANEIVRAAARRFARRRALRGAGRRGWRQLDPCLADPRRRRLDGDPSAAAAYRSFPGAASLGIAALLATAPDMPDLTGWLLDLVHREHPRSDFNRDRVEAFARRVGSA